MTENENTEQQVEAKAKPYYETVVWCVVVAAVFCVIVSALLVANWAKRTRMDTESVDALDLLKVQARARPDDVELQTEIREFDLEYRSERVERLYDSRRGGYLLLGGVIVLVICLKIAAVLNKQAPLPEAKGDVGSEQIRQAQWGRWSATAAVSAFGALALVLIALPSTDFGAGAAAEIYYPSAEEIKSNWPQFRGPDGQGISAFANAPTVWDVNTGEGIVWKKEVPLPGHSSPIVWGDRVFLSGADANEQKVFCFDANSGDILWARSVETVESQEGETEEIDDETGYAACTMVTDGRRVCAIYPTGDIGCFDFAGKRLWAKNIGIPDSVYGYASSLAMYRNLVIVQYDQAADDDGKSKVIGLNFANGSIMWETLRPVGGSWMSPVVVETSSGPQLLAGGDPLLIAHNPVNGAELWRADCLGSDLAPSPILVNDLAITIEPYTKITAYKTDGSGDVTESHLAWMHEDYSSDTPSPVSDGKYLYVPDSGGIVACLNVADGNTVWEHDLVANLQASATLVGDKLYMLSYKGVMHILHAGGEFKEVARNELGERCLASPAFMDGRIYIRTKKNLYCIGNKAGDKK
jgi:outer membrane protein assembly factor BamB